MSEINRITNLLKQKEEEINIAPTEEEMDKKIAEAKEITLLLKRRKSDFDCLARALCDITIPCKYKRFENERQQKLVQYSISQTDTPEEAAEKIRVFNLARRKRYYQENKERILRRQKENREKNRERNREKIAERHREYYEQNKERILKKQREIKSKCEVCNITITTHQISRHNRSKRHFKNVEKSKETKELEIVYDSEDFEDFN